ncbi:hypothetical protein [Halarchaeum sp. P4]|uniref:hypothetical protein n=1 Tax=Halarchaeum sp. P4 TaxID=3421639 RepID=UPI003EB71B27
MSALNERLRDGHSLLQGRAVRIPLPDAEAEQHCREEMCRTAEIEERKCELLDDPDVPVAEAYEHEQAGLQQCFTAHLQQVAGEDYYDAAAAYLDGERDDRVGALAAYYLECDFRLQERYTVDEQVSVFLVLRYPDCFTVNLGFHTGVVTGEGVRYESAVHADTDLDRRGQEQYYADCRYSQHEAACYLRERIDCIPAVFPDPETTPTDERRYGGFVHITGRHGQVFTEVLDAVAPSPDRFDDATHTPAIVAEGPEARRIKREFLDDAAT